MPAETSGRDSKPAAFALRDKGYHWQEVAMKFMEAGESISNVDSFCASMSRSYNEHIRKLTAMRDDQPSADEQ